MIFDLDMIRKAYKLLPEKVDHAKKTLNRHLTLTEKIHYSHLEGDQQFRDIKMGEEYVY